MANPLHQAGKGALNKVNKHLGDINLSGGGGILGFAMATGFETFAGMKEGKSFGASLAKGAVMGVAEEVLGGPAFMALQMAGMAPALAQAYMQYEDRLRAKRNAWMDAGNMNFSYADSRAAYTMRQAAVQAIQGSKMNARSALGGEAKLMHKYAPKW